MALMGSARLPRPPGSGAWTSPPLTRGDALREGERTRRVAGPGRALALASARWRVTTAPTPTSEAGDFFDSPRKCQAIGKSAALPLPSPGRLAIVAASRITGNPTMKTTTTLVAFLGMMLAATAADAAKFYKWTDAEGVTHYSADPPPESVEASQVKVRTRQSYDSEPEPGQSNASTVATKPARQDDKTAKKESEKKAEAASPERYAEKCKTLRADLQTIQEHARIRVKDEKGETRVLSDEEKSAQQDDIQRQIKAFCE